MSDTNNTGYDVGQEEKGNSGYVADEIDMENEAEDEDESEDSWLEQPSEFDQFRRQNYLDLLEELAPLKDQQKQFLFNVLKFKPKVAKHGDDPFWISNDSDVDYITTIAEQLRNHYQQQYNGNEIYYNKLLQQLQSQNQNQGQDEGEILRRAQLVIKPGKNFKEKLVLRKNSNYGMTPKSAQNLLDARAAMLQTKETLNQIYPPLAKAAALGELINKKELDNARFLDEQLGIGIGTQRARQANQPDAAAHAAFLAEQKEKEAQQAQPGQGGNSLKIMYESDFILPKNTTWNDIRKQLNAKEGQTLYATPIKQLKFVNPQTLKKWQTILGSNEVYYNQR